MTTIRGLLLGIAALAVGMIVDSCVGELDLDQVDEFVLEPEIELSLVYFDFLASDFDESAAGSSNTYVDSTRADLFSQDFFDKNLQAAEFTIVHNNTVARAFQAEILFKDEGGEVLYRVDVAIPAFNGQPQEVTTLIYFDESQIGILKNTFTIAAEITLLPGLPALDASSEGSLKFTSSAIFYMAFE